MAVTDDRYGADEIQVLEGLEPVRLRPGMYVGGTGQRALHHLVWEVVDNAVDEALAGHCTEIVVELDGEGVVTVSDDGRGIPVGVNRRTGVSALELVFTRLHAGGKFGSGGYKVSGGLHGVGASVTNALSAWLQVEVRREGHVWRQRYERGVRVSEVERVRPLAPGEATGTTVRWRSDDLIFDAGVHLVPTTLAARLREKAYLVRGLTFRLRLPGHDDQRFHSERGLADYVRELNEEREPVHPHVISLYAPDAEVPTEVALGWTTSSEERVYSFCNVVNTVDGGTHVSGLRRALTRCLNLHAWETGRLKRDRGETLEPKDVFEGLTAALSVMLENPQFEGQTKGRLNNGEAQAAVQSVTQTAFADWLGAKENAAAARAILERCLLGREIRLAKGRISKKLRNAATSIFSDSNLPGKLADTLDNPAVAIDDRELFVVEGDSAGGCFVGETDVRLASGRNRSLQALADDWQRGVTHLGFASNASGDVRVVPLREPRVTGRGVRLVEVVLDNGHAVRCTPDHRFRLHDGTYVPAEQLGAGTSLMPLRVSHPAARTAMGADRGLVRMSGRAAWSRTPHPADRSTAGPGRLVLSDRASAVHARRDVDALRDPTGDAGCTVVRVTPVAERADVYDLTVDRYHNFALSAGVFVHNSAKAARDASTQAILPIRGKILNVLGAKNGRAFDNVEVDNILVALGGRKDAIGKTVVATLEPAMRRYGKVVITADADADGAHIANLLVTLFHELFPRFLSEGRLFLARPPLFRVALADGTYVYVHTERELQATLKRTRRTGDHVTRFKGLGEMNADQLRETVFEPATRRLLQISMEDAALVAETVNLLMGSQAGARRVWLEDVARDVEVEV